MMTAFVTAMQAALERIQAATTLLERKDAEEAMAILIRSQYQQPRQPDVRMRQAGEP